MSNKGYDSLYRHEIYIGDYRVEWSDQKIVINCNCGETDLEIFSESATICHKCSRRYSIMEIVKVEVPDDLSETQDTHNVVIDDILDNKRRWD